MTPNPEDKLRVLLVEDAFDEALLVKAFLGSVGVYEVTHSQDGDQAAQLLRDQEWDLLITDLNLPGTDGFEVIRVSKQEHPTTPIMATTGYTAAHYQDQAFRAGAMDLMTKPLDRDEFLSRVERLVGKRAAVIEPCILAIGGLVGDVEMGCGGALMEWASQGKPVYVLPICDDEMDAGSKGLNGARAAAQTLGVNVVIDEVAMADTQRRVEFVEDFMREHPPEVMYIPSMDDDHPARREAFRIAKAASTKVPVVLGYQTATSGLDFRPGRFHDVSKFMMSKMEALTSYQEAGAGRLDLAPRMAQAYARYWGRFNKFTEVEAFEVLKG